jgi:hypothetical protein
MFDNDIWTLERNNELTKNHRNSKNSYHAIRTPFKKSKNKHSCSNGGSSNGGSSGGGSPIANSNSHLEKDLSLGFITI